MAKNNKRYRKQNKTKKFPWLLAAAGGALLLLVAVLFANRAGGNVSGSPKLSVDQDKIDYGYVKFGENRQFALKVTNAGDGTLRFKEDPYIEVLEGC
jgi:hypothetical protein